MKLKFVFKFLFLALVVNSYAQNVTIGGYVKEEHSGELLYGAAVFVPSTSTGTTTNNYGFFSLTLPEDSVDLKVSYVGYRTITVRIKPQASQILNISLPILETDEVVITADTVERISQNLQMSTITLTGAQVKDMPAFLGEKDVMKTIQLMPGVQKGSEGNNGVYVRGGGPDQNLIILDDAPIYNVSHLFGFFSIFNGDAIRNVSLMKGGFPSRYGGRLSSVIEMNMKEGNKEKIHGEAGIGILSSRLVVEGPIKKNKSSFLVSGRRSYIDLLTRPFMKKENGIFGYYFYDLNLKYNHEINPKNKIYISSYLGRDKLFVKIDNDDEKLNGNLNWGNTMGVVRWNHLFNSKLFSNVSFIVSDYQFNIKTSASSTPPSGNEQTYSSNYKSGIFDLTGKIDFSYYPHIRHEIRTGLIATWHRFTPGAINTVDNGEEILARSKRVDANDAAVYIEDTYTPHENWKVNGGIRASMFNAGKTTYINPEPRISVAYSVTRTLSAKASYSVMNQYIHLLSNTGIGLPTDLWVPTTDKIKPQQSRQGAVGIAKDLPKQNLMFSLEGYYKEMYNIVGYKEGATYLDVGATAEAEGFSWENNITQGKGWSYGAEFLVQRKVGKWTGWVGYTLSWTELQYDDVNRGKKFFARYDRRHDVSVVSIYKPHPRITLSATFVYGTGNAFTLPNTVYSLPSSTYSSNYVFYNEKDVTDFGQKNSMRMASYHRMDIGIQFHKTKKRFIRTWDLGIYNVYNRANPFAYYPEVNENGKLEIYQISLFPILPSITYNIKF